MTQAINLNQWRNTEAVSHWSKSISNKQFFTIFDTKEFFPFIPKSCYKSLTVSQNC